jgi:hypothetical protein
MPNMWHMCRNQQETIQHLFEDCALAKNLRAYVAAIQPPLTSPCPQYLNQNQSMQLLLHTSNLHWQGIEGEMQKNFPRKIEG